MNAKQAKRNALSFVVVMTVLLAVLAAFSMSVSAWTTGCGCFNGTCMWDEAHEEGCDHPCSYNNVTPSPPKYNGTIHGGIYFETGVGDAGFCNQQTMTVNFTGVPAGTIKLARVYTGIWGASPGHGCKFNITVNNNVSTDYCACDPRGGDDEEWTSVCDVDGVNTSGCYADITGCGATFISYNATGNITAGNNTVKMHTWGADDCCGSATACSDGRIYSIALLVVYENENMPEITYWIEEGTRFARNLPPVPPCYNYPCDRINVYFNGTAYPGSASDFKYWTAVAAPQVAFRVNIFPELNGKNIGKPDHGFGAYSQMYRWDNIPTSYLKTSDNHFYYYLPAEQGDVWDRINVAVLMLNSSGPANLTVTDISPSGLYSDPDETGRYANVINATVVNYGKTAHFFNVTLYANDTKVDVKKVENLGKGESRVVSFLWAPNATGPYELNITADVENIVKETDETNNSKTLEVTVTEASPPAWQSQSSNVTDNKIENGGTIELRAQGNAEIGLNSAILSTDETGTWKNCTDYGSPMDLASYYNYSVTHTSDTDWNNQTIDTFVEEGVSKPNLVVSGGDIKLNRITGTDTLAYLKPAYAKDNISGSPPGNAVNGDGLDTPWESLNEVPPTNWWYVDLEEVTTIKKVWFHLEWAYGTYHYAIYISDDGTNWTLKNEKGAANDEQDYSNLDWSCQYINITFFSASGTAQGKYAKIYEFEAYGPGNYTPNGTLTSNTIETSYPIVAVTPTWNATNSTNNSISVNISVDDGMTWEQATNNTELTWDYNVYNTSLKYKVLFETSNVSETPVMHDITLNYTTRDPIESEWRWSNFTWHNDSITDKTVGWKIYYEDMLGKTNCTDVKTFHVGGYVYDFSTGAGTDKWAFRPEASSKPPSTCDVPNTEFSSYTAISADDNDNYQSDETETTNYHAAHRFNFSISQNPDDISKINVTWNGKGWHDSNPGSTYDGAYLYIWNGTGYEELANNSGDDDWVYLTGENESAASTYINSGNVMILVVQKSPDGGNKNSHIATDYVRVAITA